MTDDVDGIERLALEMVVRFGGGAARVAHGLAEAAEEQQRDTAHAWRGIADAVERVLTGGEMQQEGAEKCRTLP
jgi:hypothetical protein